MCTAAITMRGIDSWRGRPDGQDGVSSPRKGSQLMQQSMGK